MGPRLKGAQTQRMRITIDIPKDSALKALQVGSVIHAVGTIIANQGLLMDQTRELRLANGTVVTWATEV